jgi:hypothetical protein
MGQAMRASGFPEAGERVAEMVLEQCKKSKKKG